MENKFAHLLQPIRDLAANWDVNVAEELEDYLVSRSRMSCRCKPACLLPSKTNIEAQ